MFGPTLSQVFHQVISADEVGPLTVLDGLEGQCHRQVGLAHSRRSQEQDVGGLGDEGQVGQFPDPRFHGGQALPLVDGGLEGEVELLQGALEGQVVTLDSGASGLSLKSVPILSD